jgi:hypothetical protein
LNGESTTNKGWKQMKANLIYSQNGTIIGEWADNEKNQTVVMAYVSPLVELLDGYLNRDEITSLANITNIPKDVPRYRDRLEFAINHIQSVYSAACAFDRIKG